MRNVVISLRPFASGVSRNNQCNAHAARAEHPAPGTAAATAGFSLEDAAQRRTNDTPRRKETSLRRIRHDAGEIDGEHAPATRDIVHPHLAAVRLGRTLGDGQPEPVAGAVASGLR